MATIVQHRRTGDRFILLSVNGTGNGVNPSRLLNELFTSEKSSLTCSVTLCDVEGNLFLASLDDVFVVEIEGIKPAEILPKPEQYRPQPPPSSYSYSENYREDRDRVESENNFRIDNKDDSNFAGADDIIENEQNEQEEDEQKKEPQISTRDTQDSDDLDEFSGEDEDWI